MNPQCTHIQERLIEQQLTGQTGPDDAAIQAHLQTCADCREFQKQLGRDHDRLAEYARSVEPLVTSLQDRVARRLESVRQRRSSLQRVCISIAAGVVIFVAVWAVLNRPNTPHASTTEPRRIAVEPAPLPMTDTKPSSLDQEQAQAKTLFEARDVNGLLNLLETGLAPTQALVAGYLAELNASQAMPALRRLAAAWSGDPSTNPFTQAIARIKESGQEPNRTQLEQASAKPPASPARQALRFKVIDKATGQPLPGALVKDDREGHTCDANGLCRIDLKDGDPRRFNLQVSDPGYVGLRMWLDVNELALSQTQVFALEPCTLIGGIVQDVNGTPIEGATVDISFQPLLLHAMTPYMWLEFKLQTDAAGRWFCNTMPADLLSVVSRNPFGYGTIHQDFGYGVHHDGYASYGSAGWSEGEASSMVRQLRDQTFITTLQKGFTFRGRLINPKGEPIAGAKINTSLYTGSDGTFLIPYISPDTTKIYLHIEAEGYPADSGKEIECRPGMGEVEVLLHPGYMLRGRVVDRQAMPVAGAGITIYAAHFGRSWGSADEKGTFVVGPISADSKTVCVHKDGYITAGHSLEPPPDETLEFVLHKTLIASGRVLDALTGRPIERFRIIPGQIEPEGKINYDRELYNYPGQGGNYRCPFNSLCTNDPGDRYFVIIEAEGYLPAESRVIDTEEGEAVIDLALTPGSGPAGTVVDANGQPAANAFVYAIGKNDKIGYSGFVRLSYRQPHRIQTGIDGRFSFEAFYQLRHVLAMGDQGICSMTVEDLEQTKVLMLQPWAEVHGTMQTTSGTPAKNQPVEIGSLPEVIDRFGYRWSLSSNTDDQGAFHIKQVPAGEFTLLGNIYQVAPGQVLTLDLTVDPNAL